MALRSNLVCFSAFVLGVALLMLSCGFSSPPDRLIVHVPARCQSAVLHVDTCLSGAPSNDVYLDEHGIGKTSLCPAGNHSVELEVIEDNRHYRVSSDQVHVGRTGDGIATSVEAQLPH